MSAAKTAAAKKPTMKLCIVLPRRAFSIAAGESYKHPRSGKVVQPTRLVASGQMVELTTKLANAHVKMSNVEILEGRSQKARVTDAKKKYSAARRSLFQAEHPGAPKQPTEATLAKIYGTVAGAMEDPDDADEEEEGDES